MYISVKRRNRQKFVIGAGELFVGALHNEAHESSARLATIRTSLSSPIFEVKYFPMLFTVVSVFMAVAAADMVESGFDHLRDSVGDKGTFFT